MIKHNIVKNKYHRIEIASIENNIFGDVVITSLIDNTQYVHHTYSGYSRHESIQREATRLSELPEFY